MEGFVPFDQDGTNQHHDGNLHRLGHLHRYCLCELLTCIQVYRFLYIFHVKMLEDQI